MVFIGSPSRFLSSEETNNKPMKTINAYLKIKDFSNRLEVIDTALRTTSGLEQLRSARDLLISMESLNITTALKSIAEYFKKESTGNEEEIRKMFEIWEKVLLNAVTSVEDLLSFSEGFKAAIDLQISVAGEVMEKSEKEILQKGSDHMIKGMKMYIETFECLPTAINIFDIFILPSMTKDDLQPEMEDVSLN
ncbi:hypothetical protein IPF86_01415 [Candidatus Nomurabacteria bacterium]|nr:MAG: hypothetical protein IPF86_01415 [Candidatus Nomurabacteria bacterium]